MNNEVIDDVFAEIESAERQQGQTAAQSQVPPQVLPQAPPQPQVPQPSRAQRAPKASRAPRQQYYDDEFVDEDDGTLVGVPRGYLPYAGLTAALVFLGSIPFVKNMISSTPFISSLGSFAHSTILALIAFFVMWITERYRIFQ